MTGPGQKNEFARKAKKMAIPSQYDNKDYGKKSKIVARNVENVSSGDGKFYGARTIMTKENEFLSFSEWLAENTLTEGDDITALPEQVVGEIKSNIRAGAKDLEQKWKNALELVHKAYQVTNVRRPTPEQKGAWKQYEELIKFAVSQLSATRGIDGEWRMSAVLVREFQEYKDVDTKYGKRRFFAEVPGHTATEVDGKDMSEIIEQMSNKFKRHGASVRVERRDEHTATLSIWKNGNQIDEMVIKEIS